MMKCPYCGSPLDLDDNFCSHCGKLNEQVRQHVEQARTSLKEKLPQKKREADQQSEARWAFVRQTGKKQQINTRRKNEASL